MNKGEIEDDVIITIGLTLLLLLKIDRLRGILEKKFKYIYDYTKLLIFSDFS